LITTHSYAQNCAQNLEDAKRSYYNAQFREVVPLLEECFAYSFDREQNIAALELLVNTNLLLNENEQADEYMAKLLNADPLYEVDEGDLVEFRNLFDSYEVVSKYSFGIMGGIMRPDYRIIRHQSYSGRTEEPEDYDEAVGYIVGLTGDIALIKNFYINLAVLYERRGFSQQETILGLQTVKSTEREYRLNIPLQLKYLYPAGKYRPFVSGGYSYHYLIRAEGDLIHFALKPEFTGIPIGVPFLADDYDLTHLRRRHTFNWLVSAGIQTSLPGLLVEFKLTYERGFHNLIEEEKRFKDKVLLDDFAYVPDDFKVSSWMFSLTVMRNFTKPKKK